MNVNWFKNHSYVKIAILCGNNALPYRTVARLAVAIARGRDKKQLPTYNVQDDL